MQILYFVISLAIPAAIIFVGFTWLSRYYKKDVSQTRRSLYVLVPQIVIMVLFFVLQGYFNNDFSPEPIQNDNSIETIQDAERRIIELERYTKKLEIDLDYAKSSFYLLVGASFLLYSLPLAIIAIGWFKTSEEKENNTFDK